MLCREIFDAAVAMAAEDGTNTAGISDYLERAPYLLASFVGIAFPLDARYRMAHGLPEIPPPDNAQMALNDEFPLSSVFISSASAYLAAMLVMDENEGLCDRLTSCYSDAMSAIEASLPAKTEKITDTHRWY